MAENSGSDTLITTTADKVLDYVAEHGDASAEDVAAALQLSEDVVEDWAEALAESGLLEMEYTSRGLVLKQPEEQGDAVDEHVEKTKKRVEDQITVREKHLSQEAEQVAAATDKLEKIGAILQKDRVETTSLQERLQDMEEEEEALTAALQEQEEKHAKLEDDVKDTLHTVDDALDQITAAEEDITRFEELRNELEDELDAVQRLLKHRERVDEAEEKLADVEDTEERISQVLKDLKDHVANMLPGENRYTCQTCDRSFDTERGRSVHKTKAHG